MSIPSLANVSVTTVLPLADSSLREASTSYAASLIQASIGALLMWDVIITYDQEIDLIWRTPRSVVNYFFFIIRYLAISISITSIIISKSSFTTKDNVCIIYTWFSTMATCLLISSMDAFLVYRAFAFYERDRKVLAGLITLWLLNNGILFGLSLAFCLKSPLVNADTIFTHNVFGECIAVNLPRFTHDFWISEIIFQIVLFFVVFVRFIRVTAASWKEMGIFSLYHIFVRDELWAFLHLSVAFVMSAVQTHLIGLAIIQSAIVFVGLIGSRLTLNLRNLKNCTHTGSEPTTYTEWDIELSSYPLGLSRLNLLEAE